MKATSFLSILVFVLNINCFAQVKEDPKSCKRVFDKDLNEFVYRDLSEPASYPGGAAAWQRYLNRNFHYPNAEIDNEAFQSTTVATFIVDKNGNLIKFGIKGRSKDNWTSFDSAFISTIRRSTLWNPGKCNGKIVASYFEQPIVVCLRDLE